MKKIRKTNNRDRLPELPEEILEKIFYILPTAEAAVRMSLASKAWKSFWDLLPQFHYHLATNKKPPAGSVTSEEDEPLSILTQHKDDDPKRKIGAFQIRRGNQDLDHLVDHWIKLVAKHYLIFLDISAVQTPLYRDKLDISSMYRFPCSPIDLGSLQRLCLSDCVLEEALVQNRTKLNCLKSLDLCYVELNGIFWQLLFKCPSLENLGVKFCCDHGDSNYLPFVSQNCSKGYKKTAPRRVRTLRYASCSHTVLDVKVLKIWKLEVLHIDTPKSAISSKYMKNLTSAMPSLVELRLEVGYRPYGSKPYCSEVSSHQLKSLTIVVLHGIYDDKENLTINLKTPNLGYFSYEGPALIPTLDRQQDCMNLKVIKLKRRMCRSFLVALRRTLEIL